MKKVLLIIGIISICLPAFGGVVIPRREITYNVNYHWGLIDVMIARGTVSIESDGESFYGTLDGTSIPWEGRIICVSDTLRGSINGSGTNFSENVYFQSGWYRRPPVSYFRSGTYNPENAEYFKNLAGGGVYSASEDTMEAIAVTSDMISIYCLASNIDFSLLRPGDRMVVPINGGYSRELVINYQGEGLYSNNGDNYPTYNCTFEFGYGGEMDGYPVECKIGVTDRMPLYLSASLPVGHVEMLYDNIW